MGLWINVLRTWLNAWPQPFLNQKQPPCRNPILDVVAQGNGTPLHTVLPPALVQHFLFPKTKGAREVGNGQELAAYYEEDQMAPEPHKVGKARTNQRQANSMSGCNAWGG